MKLTRKNSRQFKPQPRLIDWWWIVAPPSKGRQNVAIITTSHTHALHDCGLHGVMGFAAGQSSGGSASPVQSESGTLLLLKWPRGARVPMVEVACLKRSWHLHAVHCPQTDLVQIIYRLIDWVKVLRSTRHKVGHFGHVPQANLLAWYGKAKSNKTKAHISLIKRNVVQHKVTEKLKPGLVASYDIWPGNKEDLILISALRKFVTYLDTYPLTYSLGPTWGNHMQIICT